MLNDFYNVSKYIKGNNQQVAALIREVRLLFMIIFVCPLYKSSYADIDTAQDECIRIHGVSEREEQPYDISKMG